MKNARPTEVRPSALDALLSTLIILADSPSNQQEFSLREVVQ